MDFEFFSVIPIYEYPTHYKEVVIDQTGMWEAWILPEVWDSKERIRCCELGSYRTIDTAHPRCYFCGRFYKTGDWWKREGWTGPCTNCYENTTWL